MFLNYTKTLDLGITKLFHVYALRAVDDWFDMVLCKGPTSSRGTSCGDGGRMANYLLEAEYNASTEESYSAFAYASG